VVLRSESLEGSGSKAHIPQRRIVFCGESPKPANRRLVELGGSAPCVAGDERGRVDQAELSDLLCGHLGATHVAALERALEAAVCCPLRRHRARRWGNGFRAVALDRAASLVERVHEFDAFTVPSRRARLYRMRAGGSILVVWHSGSDAPPAKPDTERLSDLWFDQNTAS
jgi:hypothetical protein